MSTNSRYEAVIGLEIHAQLKTESKIFSSDSTQFDAGDNENTSPVSIGLPGALPVLNRKVIEYAVKTGLALGCQIRKKNVFARKNYFYPDLPKGYQISQYDEPICEHGEVSIRLQGVEKKISITRAHLEEDAGKSTHHGEYTLINYNRSGVPLLEIVSGPDMSTPQEAAEYAKTIRQLLQFLDVCDGNLEEGSLRCDCNVSVRPIGQKELGTKVELKNINSFRFVEKAIEYEIERQIDAVESGQKIVQETRLYDPDKNRTFTMRLKEDAQDYRYFPDPDLLPVHISDDYILQIQKQLPELPQKLFQRFLSQYQLPEADAVLMSSDRDLSIYFEKVVKHSKLPKLAANWIMSELLRNLHEDKKAVQNSPIQAEQLAELILMIEQGLISGKIAKTVFSEMWKTSKNPKELVSSLGLSQITDSAVIEKIIDQLIKDNPSQVLEYQSGKTKILGYFVGQAMKLSKGQANPDLLNKILIDKLTQKQNPT